MSANHPHASITNGCSIKGGVSGLQEQKYNPSNKVGNDSKLQGAYDNPGQCAENCPWDKKCSGAVSQRAPGGLERTQGHPGEGELGRSCLGNSKVRGGSVAKTEGTAGSWKTLEEFERLT